MKNDFLNLLSSAMQRRLAALPDRIRPRTRDHGPLPRACLLTGPRGVGKTTFMLFHAKGQNMLYLSADHPSLATLSLYETVQQIFMAGYEGVILDEVHHARNWSLHVKALYDDFPSHKLWVSDSSALVLRQGIGDTSRRFVPLQLPLLSFREFLFLETGKDYAIFDPFSTLDTLPVQPGPSLLRAFSVYRSRGTRPFYSEGNFEERMLAVLEKTLYSDIPFFLPGLSDGNLRLMQAILGTLGASVVPRLQVRSLCADWGLGAEKLYQMLNVMESIGLLRIVRKIGDTKAMTIGHKLLFADPCMYAILNGNIGTAREALVATLCAHAGWAVMASKDETEGDFVIAKKSLTGDISYTLEVGGPKKASKRADWVIRDDLDYPGKNAIPLWLLGMAY